MQSHFTLLATFLLLLSCALPATAIGSYHVLAKGINKGKATVYLPAGEDGGGPGHCTGILEKDDDIVTAIRGHDYRRLKKEGIDVCNKCVKFTGKVASRKAGNVGSTKSIVARIVDICEGSSCHHWDMSLGLFRKFQGVEVHHGVPRDDGPGYVNIDYEIVPCKSDSKSDSKKHDSKSDSKKHDSKSDSKKHESKSSDKHKRKGSSGKKCDKNKSDKDKAKREKHKRDIKDCPKDGKRKSGKKRKGNKRRKEGKGDLRRKQKGEKRQ